MNKVKNNSTVNCLRNSKIIVRFIPKKNDNITDKRHIAFGGMMDASVRSFTVPMLTSGNLKNVLTDDEKKCLEELLGLEENKLSIYNKVDNYWYNYQVRLNKIDTILDLSNPTDYIKYKVLLANKDHIAPSLNALRDTPKATYQYVLLEMGEELNQSKNNVNTMVKCYEEFSKVKDNFDVLKCIVETIDGRTVSDNTKIEFLQSKVNDIIMSNNKVFLQTIEDPLLYTKVLIKKAVSAGIISKRGDMYYYKADGSPLCGEGQDPTFTVAANYLNLPKNQELKFTIEANIK